MLRNFIFLLFLAGGQCLVNGQVIINEISYNPPEAGTDSLEYIELYNAGNVMVNIGGWSFLEGVEDTFPDIQLQPGEYFVTTVSAQAMMSIFGIAVHEWSGGGLNNNGEALTLVDGGGNIMDMVVFDDTDPWPTEPDGDGPSVELRSPDLDNTDGMNWQFSGGHTGKFIDGKEVSGTPGAENSGGGTAGPAVTIVAAHQKFTPRDVVVQTGDTVRWVNSEAVPHNVNGTTAAYPDNPESFTNGAPAVGPWQFDYTFTVPGLYDFHCDVHVGQGMTGTVSVYDPLAYTDFPLSHLRITDGTNGQHLFVGVPTTVTGVVHGINFQPTGYSFYVIDQNNVGINVFSLDPGSYVVTEGDLVKVSGVISQFNGLLEIMPDMIEVLNTNRPLVNAAEIETVTEEYEGSHVYMYITNVDSIVTTGTSGFNVYARNESGNPVLVRIDSDTGLDTSQVVGAIIIGIGTQFDSSFPFTEGYQLLALNFSPPPGFPVLRQDAIHMTPNPAKDILIFNSEYIVSGIELYSMDGQAILQKQVNNTNVDVHINTIPPGLYMVKALTDQGIWTSLLSVVR